MTPVPGPGLRVRDLTFAAEPDGAAAPAHVERLYANAAAWGVPDSLVSEFLHRSAPLYLFGASYAARNVLALLRRIQREPALNPEAATLPVLAWFGYLLAAEGNLKPTLASVDDWLGHPWGWLGAAAGLTPGEFARADRQAALALAGLRGHHWASTLVAALG